jgi:hypothetical protein
MIALKGRDIIANGCSPLFIALRFSRAIGNLHLASHFLARNIPSRS